MNDLILKLFPQGQRKLLVSLIALAIGVGLEKYQGGLSENLKESLIAIVAIFTGGNVMEHLANALKVIKGTKVGQIVEDIIPGDQGLGAEIEKEESPVEQFLTINEFRDFDGHIANRFKNIEGQLSTQAQNTTKIIEVLNKMQGPPSVKS